MSHIAKEHKISNEVIKKICKKYLIPVPPKGHWNLERMGYGYRKPDLKQNEESEYVVISLVDKYNDVELDISPIVQKRKELERLHGDLLQLPDRLIRPDPLILQYKQNLPLIKDVKNNYDYYRIVNYTVGSALRLRLSETTMTRGLIFLDHLLKLLKRYGIEVYFGNSNQYFKYDRFAFEFKLQECNHIKYSDIPLGYSFAERHFEFTGELEFVFGHHNDNLWRDGKREKIEKKLAQIAATIIVKIEEHEKWLEESRIKEEIEKKRKEYYRLYNLAIKKDNDNFERFANDYKSWLKMMQLRDFISLVENTNVSPESESQKQNWLTWAKSKAAIMDPMADGVENYINSFELVEIPDAEFDV